MALETLWNVTTTGKRYDDIDPPQPWYVPSVTFQAVYHSSRSVERNKTPNYRAVRLKQKWVDPLPYESRTTKRFYPQGFVKNAVWGNPYPSVIRGALHENLMDNMLARGHNMTSWNDLDDQVASEYNSALIQCRLKFNRDAAELGAGLVQFGQTYSLFKDSIIGMAQLSQAVRAKNVAKSREAVKQLFRLAAQHRKVPETALSKTVQKMVKHHRKDFRKAEKKLVRQGVDASGKFLAYSFGWAPTVSDIDNSLKQMAKHSLATDYRVSHSKTVGTTSKITDYQIGEQNSAWGKASSIREASVRVQIHALPVYHSLMLARALGLTNPPGILWEVMPFSFLFDYVVNVGQFLSSFDSLLGYDVTKTVISKRLLIKMNGKSDPPSTKVVNGNTFNYSASYALSNTWKHVRRDVISGYAPFPVHPQMGHLLKDRRTWATTLAVAVQQLSKLNSKLT